MGKFFKALEKAAAASRTGTASDANSQKVSPQEGVLTSHQEISDSIRLKPAGDSDATGKQGCQLLPVHEMLVSCRLDGDRKVKFAAEQYKMLCSQLLFPQGRPIPRTILVTSAIPGEGKSVVASNLAVSIAAGKQHHVLLIECDLRRPSLCQIFGLDNNCPGVSEYLQGEKQLSNFLRKTTIDKLTFLPAGQMTKNPYELLSSKKMRDLVDEVRKRYEDRYIILDSTPAQIAAETSVLSKFIDGVVLVIGCGKSSRGMIQDTVDKIGKEKFLGVVFNYFEGNQTKDYYYEYYGADRKRISRIFKQK